MKSLHRTIGAALIRGNPHLKIILALVAASSLATAPGALAQGCCGGQSSSQAGCPMMAHEASGAHMQHGAAQTAVSQPSAPRQVFMQPVQSVFDNYIKVQGALAQDSLDGVGAAAASMAQAIQGDSMKMLSPKVAEQAEALAKAKDLAAARTAFKALSKSLIGYLQRQKVPAGAYYVAYCPMAKASWVQTDKTILNPYMGPAMVHCGQIQS